LLVFPDHCHNGAMVKIIIQRGLTKTSIPFEKQKEVVEKLERIIDEAQEQAKQRKKNYVTKIYTDNYSNKTDRSEFHLGQ